MPAKAQHRDFIIRIGRSVRLARAAESVLVAAIWERLPLYGQAERTLEGALALACPVPPPLPAGENAGAVGADLFYCHATQRIVFQASALADASELTGWARLIEPYSVNALAAVPHGARISVLHADN